MGAGGRVISHPELIIVSRGALLDEGPIVSGDVSVVRIFFQHVDLLFDLFLLILGEREEVNAENHPLFNVPSYCPTQLPTSVTSMTLMAASCPVFTCRPCKTESQAWSGLGLGSRGACFWERSHLLAVSCPRKCHSW